MGALGENQRRHAESALERTGQRCHARRSIGFAMHPQVDREAGGEQHVPARRAHAGERPGDRVRDRRAAGGFARRVVHVADDGRARDRSHLAADLRGDQAVHLFGDDDRVGFGNGHR
jgi:hypothetical protein